MKVLVLLNPLAGTVGRDMGERVRGEFLAAGIEAEVREAVGEMMCHLACSVAGHELDAVVAAGGDGSVSTVAAALAGTPMPLGILPLGTLNHFARDLGMPADLPAAVRALVRGRPVKLDVADVNGRVFINNASIGLYPHVVRRREVERERLGSSKWRAMFFAILRVMRRFPTVRVRIGIADQTVLRSTPLVFVGNNEYEMNMLAIGRRSRLDAGHLSLYVANHTGRFGMLWLALRALVGRLEQARDFEAVCVPEVWVESNKRRLLIALDGELVRMGPPLHFRVRPRALTVLAPEARES